MPTFTLTHEIHCDEETFWKLFLDKEFNEALYRGALEFPEWNVEDQTETDTEIKRRTKGRPKLKNIPGPLVKILGDSFGYVETGSMDKAKKVWKYKLTPSTMAEKIKQEGVLRIEKSGDKSVKRVVDLTIEAKVFGIGGMLESTTEKQLREGWETSAVFMNKWIKEKGL